MKGVCLENGLKRIQDSELAEQLRTGTLCRGHDAEKTQRQVLDQDTETAGIGKVGDIGHWISHLGNRTQQSSDMA